MIELITEYILKEDSRGPFELTFGPGGAWSKLFAHSPGFRGTTILRDGENPHRYLVIDMWDSLVQRQQAVAEQAADHAKLEATLEDWVDSMIERGVFKILPEATVKPRGKSRHRRKPGTP